MGSASGIDLSASTTGDLFPGGPARTVAITVTNPGSGRQLVGSVHLDSVTASDANCDASVFSMSDVAVNQTLNPGGSVVVSGSLSMADNGANQNDCQGNSLTLNLLSN